MHGSIAFFSHNLNDYEFFIVLVPALWLLFFSQKTISSHMIFLMEASISMHCALNLEVWKLKQIEWKEEKRNVRNHIPIGKKNFRIFDWRRIQSMMPYADLIHTSLIKNHSLLTFQNTWLLYLNRSPVFKLAQVLFSKLLCLSYKQNQ